MSVTVPRGLRHAVVGDDGGQEWLDSIPARAARAAARWDLVLKLSYPHAEARDEAAALAAWDGAGAVRLLGSDADDWALLLPRLRPGGTLRDEHLPPVERSQSPRVSRSKASSRSLTGWR